MHADVSALELPVQGSAFVAYDEHVLHAEHVAPSPKYPALQVQTTVSLVLAAWQRV